MRAFTILTVVTTYVLVCTGQRHQTALTKLGLLATQIGVSPVPEARFDPSSSGSDSITGGGASSFDKRGCFCHPPDQECPLDKSKLNPALFRVANVPGQVCFGQQVCCTGGASPNSPIIKGLLPAGPIVQQNCGVRKLHSQDTNTIEASFGEYPWMTAILSPSNDFVGGGALISSNRVLTAAHKVYKFSQSSLKIRVGDHNVATVEDHPQLRHLEVPVQEIIIHPEFNIDNLYNDVALLHLSQPVNHQQSPHIGPVCLPEQGQFFSAQRCWLTGWGKDAFKGGQFQTVLRKVDLPIWDHVVCQDRLSNQHMLGPSFELDKTSFLCAGGEPGKDACMGDGGAPLVCEGSDGRFAVVGLVAWGIGCAQSDIPGVYVNVPNYVNFIRQTTGI